MTATVLPTTQRQGGFTLLEVLIAVVVFSIGLLGIGSLQMVGMKQTFNSNIRGIAVGAAQDMADRMRANRAGFLNGDYNYATAAMPTVYTADCVAAQCDPQQVAIFDLRQWRLGHPGANGLLGLNGVLPGGDGVVCLDSTPNDGAPGGWQCDNLGTVYAVKVVWSERALDATEQAQIGAATSQQRFVMRVKAW